MADDTQRTRDEIGRLGQEIYERRVLPTLRPEDDGKTVAIDVDTGEFEIDPDDYAAVTRLWERMPEAEIWHRRVGRMVTFHSPRFL
jgi:hypothetical protein